MTTATKLLLLALESIACALIAAYFLRWVTLARLRALAFGAFVLALSMVLFSTAALGFARLVTVRGRNL